MGDFLNAITFASIMAGQLEAVETFFTGPCGDHCMLCICTGQTIFTLLEVVVVQLNIQAINLFCVYNVRPCMLVFGFILDFLLGFCVELKDSVPS
jgi:hypothetical protein